MKITITGALVGLAIFLGALAILGTSNFAFAGEYDYDGDISGGWGLDYGSMPDGGTEYTGDISGGWGLDYGSEGNPCDCNYEDFPEANPCECLDDSPDGSGYNETIDEWTEGGSGSQGGFGGSSMGRSFAGGTYQTGFSVGGMTILPPRTATPPIYYYPPQQPPHYTTTSTNITNNTCTNGSCNYADNSINNSFNGSVNGNNNVAAVNSVIGTTPYYPVVYQEPPQYYPRPVPTPVPSNLYCQIYASPAVIQNGQAAYLAWTSTGGSYAVLSDGIGNVAPNGTLAVRPESSRNYVLTVYGYGGSRSCNVVVTVNGSYVSLTQIPYTGFDFGIVGNAIYWMSLLAFASSLAYLALYYNSGALALAGNAFAGLSTARKSETVTQIKVPIAEAALRAPAPIAKREFAAAPVVRQAQIEQKEFKTNDRMTLIPSREGEAPRIAIKRA